MEFLVIVYRSSFASIYSIICTKYIVIAYKISYQQPLYFGIPGVLKALVKRMGLYLTIKDL